MSASRHIANPFATDATISNTNDVTISQTSSDRTLTIDKHAIRFGNHLYLTRNLCHFGPGKIPTFRIPWILIGCSLVPSMITLMAAGIDHVNTSLWFFASILLATPASIGTWFNLTRSQKYGLLVSMSSGEKRLFPTSDSSGIEEALKITLQVLQTSYEDLSAKITVNNNRVAYQLENSGVINTGQNLGNLGANMSGTQHAPHVDVRYASNPQSNKGKIDNEH